GMPAELQTVAVGSYGIQIADRREGPSFQILASNGATPVVEAAPSWCGITLPLGDGVIQTSTIPAESSIRIDFDERPQPRGPGSNYLCIGECGPEIQAQRMRLSVLRPQDMLFLNFEFLNCTLLERGGVLRVFKGSCGDAFMKVTFPP